MVTRKFKLIKEYPGSPKLGTKSNNIFMLDSSEIECKNYPEFWEKVIEKDYEILSIKNKDEDNYNEWYLSHNGWTIDKPEAICWKNIPNFCEIHSVRRLSDDEIFTVGDNTNRGLISKINAIDNTICINQYVNSFENLKHIKKPLFTTEDGVDIFEGNTYWWVNTNFWKAQKETINNKFEAGATETGYNVGGNFSTKEKAEEYILMNKPCLSLNNVLYKYSNGKSSNSKNLIQFVKDKLKI